MAYKQKRQDLGTIVALKEIVPPAQRITEVFILTIPVGVTIALRFGQLSDPINISAAPISFAPTGDDGFSGLYFDNPVAAAGSVLDLYVATDKKELEPGTRETGNPRGNPAPPNFSHS
jgi:hypothetical protein